MSHESLLKPLAWDDVTDFADVTFGECTLDGRVLRIPVEIDQRPDNSLHLLSFAAAVSQDRIELVGQLRLPNADNPPAGTDFIDVTLPAPVRPQYSLVYRNPDGSSFVIKRIELS